MKIKKIKKWMGIMFIGMLAATAGYNVYASQNEAKLSDLMLDNVEALANENGGGKYIRHTHQTTSSTTNPSTGCMIIKTTTTMTCMPNGTAYCASGTTSSTDIVCPG
jgi:hypothetical protein